MKNRSNVLPSLMIILAGMIYFPVSAQQKNAAHRADFSGGWRSRESISMRGNIVCSYDKGDRMLAKTMKITEQTGYLSIEVPPVPGALQALNHEKLNFDGKQRDLDYGNGRGKKFTVKLSADGKTITISSIVHLMTATPYHINIQKDEFVYVTEVWRLSDDGRSISVQANAKSTLFSGERSWKTVFEKTI